MLMQFILLLLSCGVLIHIFFGNVHFSVSDAGYIDVQGYVHVLSRTDDVMNVAGHRLSSGGLEEVVARHPSVAECAVIAVPDDIKGHIPVGFAILKNTNSKAEKDIQAEVIKSVSGINEQRTRQCANQIDIFF